MEPERNRKDANVVYCVAKGQIKGQTLHGIS